MFKSYQDTSSADQFKGFPNLNFQGSNSAYGFSGVSFWLDAAFGLNTQTNLGAVSRWQQRVGGGVFEQATAGNQPRLILSDANYNNFPSVEAQDSARFMDAVNGIPFNPNITIAVISKVNTQTGEVHVITNGGASSIVSGVIDGGTSAGFTGFGIRPNQSLPSIQGTTETTTARIKIVTGTNVIVNGVNETTGLIGSQISNMNRIFRLDGALRQMIGTIAEIIAFNYSMTSTDAIALSDRINQKYALY
jgi:hypothetical protein